MPLEYFFDEEHIGEWLAVSKTEEGTQQYMDKYVFGTKNFDEYIELIGGEAKMNELTDVEHLRRPMTAPWLKKKEG